MTDSIVKSKWTLIGIEYSGLSSRPYFILRNENNGIKMMPLERGVTNLRSLLDLEEE